MDKKEQLLAIALTYKEENDHAPKLVAKGKGAVAEKILDTAKANDVPVREDKVLANALSSLDLGMYIPEELYCAVAEVLAAVIKIDIETGKAQK